MRALLLLASLLIAQNPRPEFGSISGLVRAADGSPATRVRVSAMAIEPDGTVNPAASTLASLVETDAQGRYLLENVPPGRYFVTAGFIDFPSYYPGVKTPQEARAITVAANQRLMSIDFTLAQSNGVRVRGRVTNIPPNVPPGLLTATLQPIGRPAASLPTTSVTSDGFEFLKVPPGAYNVRILPGTVSSLRIEVADRDLDNIELTQLGGLLAWGRVSVDDRSPLPLRAAAGAAGTPAPLSLVQIQANQPGMAGTAARAVARNDGLFILAFGATSGTADYVLTAATLPIGYYVKSMTSGATDLLRSPLQLTRTSPNEIQVLLTKTPPAGSPAGVTVSGRVTQLENAPAGIPAFVAMQSAASPATTTVSVGEELVNSDGRFQIRNVPAGRYQIRAVPLSSTIQTIEVADADITGLELPVLPTRVTPPTSILTSTPTSTLNQPTPAGLLISASVSARIPGRITVDDGSPVPTVDTFRGPNVQVGLQASVPGLPGRIADATTQADASFEIQVDLPAGMGEFTIDVTRLPLGYYVKSMRYGSNDLLRSPLVLALNVPTDSIGVVLTKTPPAGARGFKVSGRVTNASASIPLSLQVSSGNAPSLRIGNTNVKADGTFEINGVPPGRYRGFSPGNSGDLINFEVADRDVGGLQIALPSGALSLVMTSVPFGQLAQPPRPVAIVPGPTSPLAAPAGSAIISVAQSGDGFSGGKEGALSFFRILRANTFVEEKRLESSALTFSLPPGSYELFGYFRGCDGNCGRLSAPSVQCIARADVTAGQVLYAERVIQGDTCNIRFNPAPGQRN